MKEKQTGGLECVSLIHWLEGRQVPGCPTGTMQAAGGGLGHDTRVKANLKFNTSLSIGPDHVRVSSYTKYIY